MAARKKAAKKLTPKRLAAEKNATAGCRCGSQPIASLFSPRSTSASRVMGLAAPSPSPTYLGFDVSEYPGDAKMTAFWHGNGTPFYFTSFYLAPAPAHSDTGWMNKRVFLTQLGYGFLIIYVGRQTTNLTYARGQTDGDDAVTKASQAGFDTAVIYLDIEAGPPYSEELLNYIHGWLDKVDSYAPWFPGVYCSYLTLNS